MCLYEIQVMKSVASQSNFGGEEEVAEWGEEWGTWMERRRRVFQKFREWSFKKLSELLQALHGELKIHCPVTESAIDWRDLKQKQFSSGQSISLPHKTFTMNSLCAGCSAATLGDGDNLSHPSSELSFVLISLQWPLYFMTRNMSYLNHSVACCLSVFEHRTFLRSSYLKLGTKFTEGLKKHFTLYQFSGNIFVTLQTRLENTLRSTAYIVKI